MGCAHPRPKFGGTRGRAKGSPNHFREFPRPCSCADVARFAVRTLAGPLRVGSPSELAYKAFDDDGALHVPIGNRMGWVRPHERPLYVRVHIHLLSDVEGGEELLAQIHEVNSRLPVVRVIYKNRSVFLGIDFPALPFRAEHLTQAVTLLAQFADDVLEELRLPVEPEKVQN